MEEHQIPVPDCSNYNKSNEANLAVVMVPIPAQGHLNQFLHLSRIISSYQIPVHFVSTPNHNRQAKLRAHDRHPLTSSNLHFHDFTIPPFEVPLPDPNAPTKHFTSMSHSLIHLREPIYALLHELAKSLKRVVLIIDYFIYWVIENVSSIPNAETYCFHSSSAFCLYYIDRAITGKPVLLHGEPMKDLPPEDSVYGDDIWAYFKKYHKFESCNHGNLYDSCKAIEGEVLNHLEEEKLNDTDKHWAIGPFNLVSIPERKSSNKYLEWLDKQQPKSIIFVSFGTSVALSDEQVKEMALGLERSGQNFMWVLRGADTADIFVGESRKYQLPEGFEERVEGRGIIIRDWAPQLEILGHPSTGGFLSHCGWNSCVESISMGVPIAAWPVHSDQPMNAILISQVLKIGLMAKEWAHQHEVVKAETIEDVVKRLMASMEGVEMRQRVEELSIALKQSVKEDGATAVEIASYIAHITR